MGDQPRKVVPAVHKPADDAAPVVRCTSRAVVSGEDIGCPGVVVEPGAPALWTAQRADGVSRSWCDGPYVLACHHTRERPLHGRPRASTLERHIVQAGDTSTLIPLNIGVDGPFDASPQRWGPPAHLQPERVGEVDRIPARVAIEVEPAGQPEGVFLGESPALRDSVPAGAASRPRGSAYGLHLRCAIVVRRRNRPDASFRHRTDRRARAARAAFFFSCCCLYVAEVVERRRGASPAAVGRWRGTGSPLPGADGSGPRCTGAGAPRVCIRPRYPHRGRGFRGEARRAAG